MIGSSSWRHSCSRRVRKRFEADLYVRDTKVELALCGLCIRRLELSESTEEARRDDASIVPLPLPFILKIGGWSIQECRLL